MSNYPDNFNDAAFARYWGDAPQANNVFELRKAEVMKAKNVDDLKRALKKLDDSMQVHFDYRRGEEAQRLLSYMCIIESMEEGDLDEPWLREYVNYWQHRIEDGE